MSSDLGDVHPPCVDRDRIDVHPECLAAMSAEQVCSAVALLALVLHLVLAAVVVAPRLHSLAHLLVLVVSEVCAHDQVLRHVNVWIMRAANIWKAFARASAAHPQAQP